MKHQRTAGCDFRTVTIGETTYKLRPLTLGDYAEMEAFVASQRKSPFKVVSESIAELSLEHQRAAWDAAVRAAVSDRIVPASEIAAFENSILGLSWKLWKCLSKDHPEVDSHEAALKIVTSAGPACLRELQLEVHIATGEADLGK